MADSKKYNGSTWEHSLRKLTTSTDTFTTLPADIYADGNNATVGISGNTVQNGTPTPDNPITPQGCGDLETVGTKAGQFKIPISSASTTTPVYLGEVETTRKIKKWVLTSRSDADNMFAYNGIIYVQKSGMLAEVNVPFCNCLVGTNLPSADAPANSIRQLRVNNQPYPAALTFKIDGVATSSEFENFLLEMNSAGTPVTVWYVLDTAETGIVNEPLMKIGDYADTVSGITIPTITSKDTFDVDTTLKPSKVKLTYTGWHDASVQEWDGSQWNE